WRLRIQIRAPVARSPYAQLQHRPDREAKPPGGKSALAPTLRERARGRRRCPIAPDHTARSAPVAETSRSPVDLPVQNLVASAPAELVAQRPLRTVSAQSASARKHRRVPARAS